jgi:small subunit ribosomal protein S11
MAVNTTKSKVIKKSKLKKKISIVKIFLRAEFNNTILTLTDLEGKVVAWSSSGKVGFKGAKKSTPFASQKVTEEILEKARAVEANTVHIVIKGSGMGRDSFLRSLQNSDFSIASIKDVTGFPFGGPRPKKRRRI